MRRRPPPQLRVEPIAAHCDREAWSELAERSRNIFATPEWIETWRTHLAGRGEPLLLGARRRDGSLAAVFALTIQRRGLRIARFMGHGPSDEMGPICAPEDRPAAAEALLATLRDGTLRAEVLLAERLPGDAGWPAHLRRRPQFHESTPVFVNPRRDWAGLVEHRGELLTSEERRRERLLARAHGLRYRLTEDPATLAGDLDALARLHGVRWGSEGSGALGPERMRFHHAFAARALERGWLRLWTMELEGEPVAVDYSFRFANVESLYQRGRNPEWNKRSVGTILLVHGIRSAIDDGVPEYRFLRGDEGYKSKFATGDPGLESFLIGRGAAGGLAVTAARAALAGPPTVARRVRRLMRL